MNLKSYFPWLVWLVFLCTSLTHSHHTHRHFHLCVRLFSHLTVGISFIQGQCILSTFVPPHSWGKGEREIWVGGWNLCRLLQSFHSTVKVSYCTHETEATSPDFLGVLSSKVSSSPGHKRWQTPTFLGFWFFKIFIYFSDPTAPWFSSRTSPSDHVS